MSSANESWSVISIAVLLALLLGIVIGVVLKISFRSLIDFFFRPLVNFFKGKSRKKIGWIAITLGWLGIHRFKLGNKKDADY